MNIAIFSPNKNPYSETFIQAHKNYLKDKVFHYYGYLGVIELANSEKLVSYSKEWKYRILRNIMSYPTSYINKKAVLDSLKKRAIDVILVEYGTHAYHLLSLLKASDLPFVVHFHGHDASVYETIRKCENYKDVFSLASNIVVVSKIMRNKLIELGCDKKDIVYSPCAANQNFQEIEPNFSKNQFLCVGRFTNKKAPYYTIMAFKEVSKKYPEAKLLLAGEGMLINMCKNLVKHYRLETQVEFLGVIQPKEYRDLLSESIGFVQHSITAENGDMEGTPVAIMEASAAGLPVIATKHAGISDVIVHGETGLLCDEHDVTGMANNMLQIIGDVNYAKELGNNGKQYILKHFNMKIHISKLQEVLESAYKNYKL